MPDNIHRLVRFGGIVNQILCPLSMAYCTCRLKIVRYDGDQFLLQSYVHLIRSFAALVSPFQSHGLALACSDEVFMVCSVKLLTLARDRVVASAMPMAVRTCYCILPRYVFQNLRTPLSFKLECKCTNCAVHVCSV